MDTVTIVRALRRRRLLVAVAALVAVMTGLAVAYEISPPFDLESRRYEVAVATARILVDTPSSQVVQVAPKGSDVLGVRATLLSNLMVEGVIKTAIAERAGLDPRDMAAVAETTSQPAVDEEPGRKWDYVLLTRVLSSPSGDQLPVIEIETQAPDARRAVMLADAAMSGLQDHLDSLAADEEVSSANRLRVTGQGSPQVRIEDRGPGRRLAIAATLLVFLLSCGIIVALPVIARVWNAAKDDDGDDRPMVSARANARSA